MDASGNGVTSGGNGVSNSLRLLLLPHTHTHTHTHILRDKAVFLFLILAVLLFRLKTITHPCISPFYLFFISRLKAVCPAAALQLEAGGPAEGL